MVRRKFYTFKDGRNFSHVSREQISFTLIIVLNFLSCFSALKVTFAKYLHFDCERVILTRRGDTLPGNTIHLFLFLFIEKVFSAFSVLHKNAQIWELLCLIKAWKAESMRFLTRLNLWAPWEHSSSCPPRNWAGKNISRGID